MPEQHTGRRRVLRASAVGLFVLVGTVGCGTSDDGNQFMDDQYEAETAIRTTATKLFEAMSRNDWDRYNELQCTKQRSDDPVDPWLAEKLTRLEIIGVDVTERTGSTAQVDVDFSYSDEPAGTSHAQTLTVIKEGGNRVAC